MKFAFADPPYLGRAEYYRAHHADAMIWDDPETHRSLIARLQAEYPDGWVLCLQERSLRTILPMCPTDARTAAWITDRARYAGRAVAVRRHFEPVIFWRGRGGPNRAADFVFTGQEPMPAGTQRYAMNKSAIRAGEAFLGRKPAAFCRWVLDLLGYERGDQVDDLFPGTGAMGRVIDGLNSTGHQTLPMFAEKVS
ncbi:MAG: hypothetical protein Q7T86_03315 [Hyphomicrobiaceae bacterium]|nr:hypothetical protein [Hyphomicrobiaceae bacterium]